MNRPPPRAARARPTWLDEIEAHYAKTEAHRHECEVRHVAALPSREHRKAYLYGPDGVEGKRGKGAVQRIIADLNRLAAKAA